jgi:hypothetical protein
LAGWQLRLDTAILALAHLVDLAEDGGVHELSAVVLDKLLLDLAIHSSPGGAYGALCEEAEPVWLRSSRFTPASALSRLLWGLGSYEGDLRAAISLGLAGKHYQLPELIRAIALDRPESAWVRQRGRDAGGHEVNPASYKTPDYLLSSAQDYRPGAAGCRQHVWQATLGPEALVFANHPVAYSQSAARAPGWWVGNGCLPRIAQWHDALIALYNLPADDWLGFTHAYFPTYTFDEHAVEGGWAFARAGRAYLALWASPGVALVEHGPDAFREVRARGPQSVWLCQMGRETLDGSFAGFRRQVLAAPPQVAGLQVAWQTIRGERLAFDWEGALHVDGQPQPITDFPHHESPYAAAGYPAESLDIVYGQDLLRLNLAV